MCFCFVTIKPSHRRHIPVCLDAGAKPGKMGRVATVRASGIKLFCQIIQMCIVDKFIPDRSQPGLPTTASGVTQQGTCGNYATASENKSRKRGGRQVKRQWMEKGSVERKTLTHKGGYLKY